MTVVGVGPVPIVGVGLEGVGGTTVKRTPPPPQATAAAMSPPKANANIRAPSSRPVFLNKLPGFRPMVMD